MTYKDIWKVYGEFMDTLENSVRDSQVPTEPQLIDMTKQQETLLRLFEVMRNAREALEKEVRDD